MQRVISSLKCEKSCIQTYPDLPPIANCIVAYNSMILNAVYENMLKASVNEEIIVEFARISPIAWVHISFTGKYSFKKSTGVIDIVALAHEIEKYIKQHFWKDA